MKEVQGPWFGGVAEDDWNYGYALELINIVIHDLWHLTFTHFL